MNMHSQVIVNTIVKKNAIVNANSKKETQIVKKNSIIMKDSQVFTSSKYQRFYTIHSALDLVVPVVKVSESGARTIATQTFDLWPVGSH